MNMVPVTTDLHRITLQCFTPSSEVVEQFRFDCVIDQMVTVFCAEDNMSLYIGQRLWHSDLFVGIALFPPEDHFVAELSLLGILLFCTGRCPAFLILPRWG